MRSLRGLLTAGGGLGQLGGHRGVEVVELVLGEAQPRLLGRHQLPLVGEVLL